MSFQLHSGTFTSSSLDNSALSVVQAPELSKNSHLQPHMYVLFSCAAKGGCSVFMHSVMTKSPGVRYIGQECNM